MEQDWTKIKICNTPLEAEIIRQMLVENGVPAVVINKQDIIVRFGKVELYVQNENETIALGLIDQYAANITP